MTFNDLQNASGRVRAAVALENFAPSRLRKILKEILVLLVPLLIALSMFFGTVSLFSVPKLFGAFFAVLFLWSIVFMLDAFFYSIYFDGIRNSLHELGFPRVRHYIPFEVFFIALSSDPQDVTAGFINSPYGQTLFRRLGIGAGDGSGASAAENFLKERKTRTAGENLILPKDPTLSAYVGALLDADHEFLQFFLNHGFMRTHVVGTADWIQRMIEAGKARHRWWSRDSLGRIRGIGKEWAHGETYHLQKYGRFIAAAAPSFSSGAELYEKEINALERVLARSKEANALLVGEENDELLDVVEHLAGRIEDGTVLPQLEHKRPFLLDVSVLVASTGSKTDLERELINVLNEAVQSEHIILVIPNFGSLVSNAQTHDVEILEILDEYLRSSNMQIIALADKDSFMEVIEKNTELMSRFEKILVSSDEHEALIHALQGKVAKVEKETGLFFTFRALLAIREGAERYFGDSTIVDKTSDLLSELAPKMIQNKKRVVTKEDVDELIKSKTGIPQGEVRADEKSKLMNLEKVLHERIVGQDAAVSAISNALRRARSGIQSEKRPMGSFLFLGPTGVGKTETTKALAEVFFGQEAKILRFDMSEYNSPDSLARLIGAFEADKNGTLSEALREHPYGVLLLDEFEKSDKKVLDLFLQILDEGFFSDMRGKRVNARNLIIIATSNAGSDMIWNLAKEGKDVSASRDEIIDTIVKQGIFKPELLNRFDGVILFHPLGEEHLKKVARLLLGRLEARLKDKGIEFVVNDDLVRFLVSRGTDPKFGARPLNRAIQDNIEKIIAERMIRGEIKAGSKVELRESDLLG